ncbi:hypothetical protein IWZ01DRAFT_538531 [Phyllosticta capitalensis]
MTPVWAEKKVAANLEAIGRLEMFFRAPLAHIFKNPSLSAREALAMPTDLLDKVFLFAKDFLLDLLQLHTHLDRKWAEKEKLRCEAVNPYFRNLQASDIDELVKETPSPRISLSPKLEALFEDTSDDTGGQSRTPDDIPRPGQTQGQVEEGDNSERARKRQRLRDGEESIKMAESSPSRDVQVDNEALCKGTPQPSKSTQKPSVAKEQRPTVANEGNLTEPSDGQDQVKEEQQKTQSSLEALVSDLQRRVKSETEKRLESEQQARDLEAQLMSYQQRFG